MTKYYSEEQYERDTLKEELEQAEAIDAVLARTNKPPVPPKRQQPKITRHQSSRQRQVERTQTNNPIKAMFGYSDVILAEVVGEAIIGGPSETEGTREVGPGDKYNQDNDYRLGAPTESFVRNRTAAPRRNYKKRGRPSNSSINSDAAALLKKLKEQS
jgi:hypothetical protein